MANIKSAKKRARQNEKRRVINVARRSTVKTSIKKVMAALEANEAPDKVMVLFNEAQAQIARACGKGLLHDNTASRKVSRLAKQIKNASVKK